jgi:hypothetical protein
MSDSEDDFKIIEDVRQEEQEQHPEAEEGQQQPEQHPGKKKQGVYKQARADDKRKEISKMNIEKARMVRNFKLNEKKKKKLESTLDRLNEVTVNDSDSDTAEEIVFTRSKNKKQTGVGASTGGEQYSNARLDRIEGILTKLARKHKPTPSERKTIIQLTQPDKKEDDDIAKHFKNRLLLKL